MDPTTTAIGTWSGGRFMHFGEPLARTSAFTAMLRPGEGIDTVITADVYGAGEADLRSAGRCRASTVTSYCLIGAIGHDFYEGERDGAKGFPRFTDPRLRSRERLRGLHPHGDRAQPRALRGRALRPAAAAQPRPHRLLQPGRLGGDGGASATAG